MVPILSVDSMDVPRGNGIMVITNDTSQVVLIPDNLRQTFIEYQESSDSLSNTRVKFMNNFIGRLELKELIDSDLANN